MCDVAAEATGPPPATPTTPVAASAPAAPIANPTPAAGQPTRRWRRFTILAASPIRPCEPGPARTGERGTRGPHRRNDRDASNEHDAKAYGTTVIVHRVLQPSRGEERRLLVARSQHPDGVPSDERHTASRTEIAEPSQPRRSRVRRRRTPRRGQREDTTTRCLTALPIAICATGESVNHNPIRRQYRHRTRSLTESDTAAGVRAT